MDTQPLKLKVDSGQAQADLTALAKSLDMAGDAALKTSQQFQTGMAGVTKAINGSLGSMEKFAKVAGLLSKIKLDGTGAAAVGEFAKALTQLSRAKEIEQSKLNSYRKFIEVGAQVSKLRFDGAATTSILKFTQALDTAAKARAITPAKMQSWVKFIEVAARASQLRMGGNSFGGIKQLADAMDSISKVRSITPAKVAAIKSLFEVLGSAKSLPNAGKVAADLDKIAAAAGRAATSLNALPNKTRGLGANFTNATKNIAGLHNEIAKTPGHAVKAEKGLLSLGGRLTDLSGRFKLSYQAGTAFSAFFSAFTFGQFLKGVYDTNIALAKLQKALLFSTGTFKGAHEAMDRFIGTSLELGLNLEKTAEAYGRFTLSSKASGIGIDASEKIFKSVASTLQVVGANSEQTELAFYGLTQMIQKGKVSAEEFNRQIGEQIPGNAVIGARALSKLEGRVVSVSEFFKKMSLGQIMSTKFVPAYAEALQDEFGDLLKIAQRRPDVALNRLTTAFTLFKKAVGDSGFMAAVGREFGRLTDKLLITVDGQQRLAPAAQKLADTLGKNLASMVRVLGSALEYLVDNLDGVVASIKALAALKLGATFIDWGSKATAFAVSLVPVKKEVVEIAAAEVVMNKAGNARTGADVAAAVGAAGNVAGGAGRGGRTVTARGSRRGAFANAFQAVAGGLGASASAPPRFTEMRSESDFRRAYRSITPGGAATLAQGSRGRFMDSARQTVRPGANYFEGVSTAGNVAGAASGFQGSRKEFGLRKVTEEVKTFDATATKASKGGVGSFLMSLVGLAPAGKTAAVGVAAAEGGAVKAVSGFGKLLGVAGKVAPLLGLGIAGAVAAAGIALAAFGDNLTTVGGKSVKFNDIVGGGFKIIGDRLGGFWEESKKGLKGVGLDFDFLGKNMGEFVTNAVAAFVTLGDVIGQTFKGIAKLAFDLISNSPLVKLIEIFNEIRKGNFKGAGDIVSKYVKSGAGIGQIVGDVVDTAKNVTKAAGGYGENRRQVEAAAVGIAADRNAQVSMDAKVQQENMDLERQMAARQQAFKDQESQGELQALKNRAALGDITAPSWDSVFQKFADAGTKTADAATVAADAAKTTASAATVAATGVSTAASGTATGGGRRAANQNVAEAITTAAKVTGVNEEVLSAIAYRESKFNPKAANAQTSARGLFQFTYGTARDYGLTKAKSVDEYKRDPGDAFDANASALAAGRYATANAEVIKKKTGRDATGGEIYAAHFMGAGGVSALIDAINKNPAASFQTLFPKEAKSNPFTQGKTVKQVYDNLTNTVGGSAGSSAAVNPRAALDGLTEVEGESITAKWENLNKQLAALTKNASPAEEAVAQMQTTLDRLSKLGDANQKLVDMGAPSQFTPEVSAALKKLRDKLMQDVVDAANPFAKDARLAQQEAEVTKLRVGGMSDEAEFKSKLNALYEQGYDITKLDTQANRDLMKTTRQQTDALSAQLDVVNALNDAQQERLARTGSAQDIAFASAIRPKDGQSLQQAIDAMSPAEIAARRQAASVAVDSRREGAQYEVTGQLQEMRAQVGLGSKAKGLRDDYKTYLEQLSGITDASLTRLEARADPALKALAKQAADIKYAIENPPGFQKWAQGLEPLRDRLEDIKAGFAENLSGAITDALSGEKVDWRSLVHNASKEMLKARVDEGLKGAINLFSGGPNRGGTAPGPTNTGATGSGGRGLFSSLFGGGTTDTQQAVTSYANGTDLSAAGGAQDTSSGLGKALSALGWSQGGMTSQWDMAGSSAAGGNTSVTDGLGKITGPMGAAASMGAASQQISNAMVTAANMTVTASSVTLNAGSVTGGGAGGAGGLAGAAGGLGGSPLQALTVDQTGGPGFVSAGAGLPDTSGMTPFADLFSSLGGGGDMGSATPSLSGFTESNPVSAMSALSAMSVDQSGGPGFMPAGSGMPDLSGMTAFGEGGGLQGLMQGGAGLLKSFGPLALSLLTKKKKKKIEPMKNINGVIGEARPVTVEGTQVAAHSNIIADLANMALSAYTGGFGQGGGMSIGNTLGNMGSSMSSANGNIMNGFSKMFGSFREGGYADSPVQKMGTGGFSWHNAPHYAEGTPNTNGGMPAILHPNEAVIPLSRGRNIPVELPDGAMGGAVNNITSRITVVAPNPDAFRKSSASITRQQNRDLKRAAARNLGPR